MEAFSGIFVPLLFCFVGLLMFFSKKDLMGGFIDGAREGIRSCVELMPSFLLLICAVKMFNVSGAAALIASALSPVLSLVGIPSELTPLIVVRPVSGGASNAVVESILNEWGADSFVGRVASVIAGSSDTVFYITALYYSSVKVTKSRYTLFVSLTVMIFCILFSCIICRIFFS